MKKKNRIWIYPLIVMGVILILTNSCKNNNTNKTTHKLNNVIVFNSNLIYGTAIDIDSNVYKTITIGHQTWMAENLKATHYRNGDPIPNITDNSQWGSTTIGAYCDYDNTASISTVYGKLYNWYAITDSRNIAPTGWHMPADAEWTTLINYLGGIYIASVEMKESDTTHWEFPNEGANNNTGFTALPGGFRYYDSFANFGTSGYWWSSTECNSGTAWKRSMYSEQTFVYRDCSIKKEGLSVRCVKD